MNPGEAMRLEELERENARLKKLMADQILDLQILRESSPTSSARTERARDYRQSRQAVIGSLRV
jgi:hypothetical protein